MTAGTCGAGVALAACLLATGLAAQEVALDGPPVDVVLSVPENGGPPSWSVEHECAYSGRLYFWAVSPDYALTIRVERPGSAAPKEGRERPGVPTDALLDASPGSSFQITVLAEGADQDVPARVHLASSVETEATQSAVREARESLRAAADRIRGGGGEAARRELRELALRIEAVDGAAASFEVASLLFNLGGLARRAGDLALSERSLARARDFGAARFPATDRWLLAARMNLAITLRDGGRLELARDEMEDCLATFLRFLPEEHDDVVRSRANLGVILGRLGELTAARAMFERVISAWSARLPEDHVDLVKARQTVASFLRGEGDLAAAQELNERCIGLYLRTLPENDAAVRKARTELANVLRERGELERAHAIQVELLEQELASYPEAHPSVLLAKQNLALTLGDLGRREEACELCLEVVDGYARTFPDTHPALQEARNNLGMYLLALGRESEALALFDKVLSVRLEELPLHHPRRLVSRINLVRCQARLGLRDDVRGGCLRLAEAARGAVQAATPARPPREVEALALKMADAQSTLLSLAAGAEGMEPFPELEPAAFELVEAVRGSSLKSARVLAAARDDPELAALRDAASRSAALVAGIAERGEREGYIEAVIAHDAAQKRLLEHIPSSGAGTVRSSVTADRLARQLMPHEAIVSFCTSERKGRERGGPEVGPRVMWAFVVRDDRPLTLVELGPLSDVERAVGVWRRSVGASDVLARSSEDAPDRGRGMAPQAGDRIAAGRALRALVLDPLAADLEGTRSWTLVPDDVLHGVAFDALPAQGEPDTVLGDHRPIRVRSTLWELVLEDGPPPDGGLVALAGDIDYGAAGSGGAAASSQGALAGHLRSGPGPLFGDLPFTAVEVERIAELARESSREVSLLTGAHATRDRLYELASGARWLHLATHGYFAPDTIRSTADGAPSTSRPEVGGISPMVLCGLALAGANREPDAFDRVRGVVTAEELATFDLSDCELAVLSACETHVGVRRAGQGLASLQKALHMAGARSVVTAIWKVPDEATAELMVDFYRRLWEDGETKHRALWLAKQRLRAEGRPLRDWAGWVLTGDPD